MKTLTRPMLRFAWAYLSDNVWLTLCLLMPLLITFANNLDPVQAGQNVRPDLDPS